MKKLAHFIVHKRCLISTLFILLVILCTLLFPLVEINYDMTEYLKDDMPSKQAIDIVDQEFGMQGMARIMINGISITQGKDIKNRIEQVEGVDMVLWLDSDIDDLYAPTSFINQEDIKDYSNDGAILFDVTFVEDDSSPLTHQALDEIKKIAGENSCIGGSAMENKSVKSTLMKEVAIAMCIAVPIVFLILMVTTTSYLEPVLFLAITGLGIIINLGSNIIFGQISFFTFSVAAILQLAISMDYSIFLLHSFIHEKENGVEDEEVAMENAISNSIVSILSSGLTTIVGFVALALMQFEIGKDMGLVLAKGIVISLFAVIFFMPSMILKYSAKIEKYRHKPFIVITERFTHMVYKARFIIIPILLILVIPCYVGQNMNTFLYGNDALGSSEGTTVYTDKLSIEEKFGKSNMMLAIVPRENNIKEKEMGEALEALSNVRYAKTIASELPAGVPESFLPESTTKKFHSNDYTRYLISVYTDGESQEAFDAVNSIQAILNQYYPNENYIAGGTPSTLDIKNVIETDYSEVNFISILGIGIIILFTFKSLFAPVVLLLVIESGIFINMAIPYLAGDSMIFMGYLIVSCIQLGATIDYGILMTDNYMHCRETMDKKESALGAIKQSALSVLTSGFVLTSAAFTIGKISTVAAIGQIGELIARGAVLSMILVLSALPTFLVLCDTLIQMTNLKNLKNLRFISIISKHKSING
ncbi:MAG: multidrug transporter [Cellulosilyticum sp.]|nr:multidrug transporter [Cellulosilyticum sp.]